MTMTHLFTGTNRFNEVSALTTATAMPLYKELKGVIGILSIYRLKEVAS
jgi:hypothetical protein